MSTLSSSIVKIVDAQDFPEMMPTVARWHHKEWAHLNPGQSLSIRIEQMAVYIEASATCTTIHSESPLKDRFRPKLFVALNDKGKPIGTAALDLHDMDDKPHLSPWLASVYVVPEMRSQGVATALIKHALNFAKGVERLYLFTPGHKCFYERLGWSQLQRLSYYGEEVDLMSYTL